MRKPHFHLTRHAAMVLRDIHAHSLKQWVQKTAEKYMAEIYAVMTKASTKPDIGKLRARRSVPFLMARVGKHFIVYDRLKRDIIILALLHLRRDIERIITDMCPAFVRPET